MTRCGCWVRLFKCLIQRWTTRWCWRLKSETEPLLGVTPHTPVSSLFLSLLFLVLPTHHHFLFSSDLTSRLCLTDCVWLLRTARQSEGAQRTAGRRGMRENDGGGQVRGGGGFRGRKRDIKGQSAKRGERTGEMSLGKRLDIKTQGNWETKSKPELSREEDEWRDEGGKKGKGLEWCDARITTTILTSSGGAEQMHTTELNSSINIVWVTYKSGVSNSLGPHIARFDLKWAGSKKLPSCKCNYTFI